VIDWPGTVHALWEAAKALEAEAGRVRGVRNGPRTLDVDILYFGTETVDEPRLTVPHPRWMERRFVVEPLAELRAELTPPGSSLSVRQALAGLPAGGVKAVSEAW
jgi:2-amino-4-hydroxy-6-hydroxymethyldihydropteridine diphosphokinase